VALTIDITGVAPERYLFAPSPLAELTSMMHALSEPGHHPALHGWIAATGASLKPELSERMIEADFLWRSARADFFVPGLPHPVPLDLVQRRIDALAHPVRRRLARTIARGPHTTGELADAWQLTAPEVSRHLAVLKRAGLVTVSRRGRYVLYQLDLTVCARLGADFVEAILR
jgi:DNA-binding transcriptional ArsR family regulator